MDKTTTNKDMIQCTINKGQLNLEDIYKIHSISNDGTQFYLTPLKSKEKLKIAILLQYFNNNHTKKAYCIGKNQLIEFIKQQYGYSEFTSLQLTGALWDSLREEIEYNIDNTSIKHFIRWRTYFVLKQLYNQDYLNQRIIKTKSTNKLIYSIKKEQND